MLNILKENHKKNIKPDIILIIFHLILQIHGSEDFLKLLSNIVYMLKSGKH